ncbi:hypothetical protein QUF88_16860 [Bacillus sp. DX1.1]|uniref:hypothetical protein n=1 Tax=unclassified Bacillus (in: firmicutes) TaxID=185979 RepID=UPI002570E289|nr:MULTISPECIES: hypothetical protein [unclassified Bacillus (in: firmicutes)]MDM5155413.1 hypothetical protein [Bacillus sp. DX1.1]WJE79728.1 hypothetical protein QRE67_14380 [Bacillus sp. DX3.1]
MGTSFGKYIKESGFAAIGIDGAGNLIGCKLLAVEIIRVYMDTGEQEWIASNFEEYLHKAFKEEIQIHF